MAPRRSSRKVVSVTKKKRVVEETVKVTVFDGDAKVTETESLENNQQETEELTLSIPVGEEEPPDKEAEDVVRVEIPVSGPENRSPEPPPQPPQTPGAKGEERKSPEIEKEREEDEGEREETHEEEGGQETAGEGIQEKGLEEEKTGKEEKSAEETPARKRRRRRGRLSGEGGGGYRRYVWKVMKEVHPKMGISGKAMSVLNTFMGDMFERIAEEAARLNQHSRRRTMSAREIQAAVRLVLPGELSRHAVAEGSKAVSNYVAFDSKKP
ncbi:PREDICTED: histone H2B.2 [Tarenaya hassleriana]|uniref:histone H2B.2 n=1 Tax=Tarenaya hassleriana TaxID=28532 RepID=UPI00053C2500|nr:PREDICTED: histone H2B.2 [Tarenaya hassleriana]